MSTKGMDDTANALCVALEQVLAEHGAGFTLSGETVEQARRAVARFTEAGKRSPRVSKLGDSQTAGESELLRAAAERLEAAAYAVYLPPEPSAAEWKELRDAAEQVRIALGDDA